RRQLGFELLGALGQRSGSDVVLAGEILDRGEAPLDLVLTCRVEIEPLEIMLHLARRLPKLNDGALEEGQKSRDLRIERARAAQRRERAARGGMRARLLALVKVRERKLCALGELAAVDQARALLRETLALAFAERERFELTKLVFEELEARIAIVRLALELQGAVEQRQPHAVSDTDLAGERDMMAVRVEQLALCAASRQRLE